MAEVDREGTPRLPPSLPEDAHKGSAGRVLVLAGSRAMPGAAILCVRAAQRAGAGLVTLLALDHELVTAVPAASPETVLAPLAVEELAEALERPAHALLAGPGTGATPRTLRAILAVLEAAPDVPRVLDADALNVLADDLGPLRAARGPVVLTPHPGEAGRLLGRSVPPDADGRIEAARELAARTGALVVLKGRGTVLTDGERLATNATGNAGMASAGTGDVLAGVLVAYLARARAAGAPDLFEAARAAVHVHGLAGDRAAQRLGRRGLIASDLIEELPLTQRSLDEA